MIPSESDTPDHAPPARPTAMFIFGVARSGTSYTHLLLTTHAQIRMSYESHMVTEGDYYYQRHASLDDRAEFDRLLDEIAACDDHEPLSAFACEAIRAHRNQLFESHQADPGFGPLIEQIHMLPEPVDCWGSKLLRVELLPRLRAHWPHAKALILVRDPRAVYSSRYVMQKAGIRYDSIYWNLHSVRARQLAGEPDIHLVVQYEQLVREPRETLDRIFAFAGVAGGEATEEILRRHPPRPESLDKWRTVLSEKQIALMEGLCFEEMQRWGYVPEKATRPMHLGRTRRAYEIVKDNFYLMPWSISAWRRKRILQRFVAALRGR